jgi:hypothetical protein
MAEIRVPAHVQPYVTAIGIERTYAFLRAFGGSYVYLSENPQGRSDVVKVMGVADTIALAKQVGTGNFSIPTAKPFIAAYLKYMKGLSNNDICRELLATAPTVRKWLSTSESRQLDLFAELP